MREERVAVYLLFGSLALADGHTTDAALHFEKALAVEVPSNWNEAQRKYLQQACLEGKTAVALRRGDWKAAAALFQQQVDAHPKNAQLRDQYATALFRAGELERAFEQFDLAFLQDKTMNRPEISMAVMYIRATNYDMAEKWFQQARREHPEEPSVYFEHSIGLLYQDRAEEAAKSAAKAAELGMDSPLLSMHRGLVALQQGDSEAAQTFFEQVLAASPGHVGAMTKLALLLVESKDPADRERAVEFAEAAARMRPNVPEAAAVLGWVYFRVGEGEKAHRLLRAAAGHTSADPLALFLYARLLFLEQQLEEGRKVAELLSRRIEQPGLVPLRPVIRKWLRTVLADAN